MIHNFRVTSLQFTILVTNVDFDNLVTIRKVTIQSPQFTISGVTISISTGLISHVQGGWGGVRGVTWGSG